MPIANAIPSRTRPVRPCQGGRREIAGDRAAGAKEAGSEPVRSFQVERVRFHQGAVILKLVGCDSRTEADTLRGQWLHVPFEEAIPLAENEFFLFQLIGLEVQTTEGDVLGEVVEVLQTGANDVYVVRGATGEILLPDIPHVVKEIILTDGRMLVQLPPGLRDG